MEEVDRRLQRLYKATPESVQLKELIRTVTNDRKADALLLGGTDSAILG